MRGLSPEIWPSGDEELERELWKRVLAVWEMGSDKPNVPYQWVSDQRQEVMTQLRVA
jgi:hypothetical protein